MGPSATAIGTVKADTTADNFATCRNGITRRYGG